MEGLQPLFFDELQIAVARAVMLDLRDFGTHPLRLNKAMGKKERILIYGDYDVDGTTAVAPVSYTHLDVYKRQSLICCTTRCK